MNPDPLPEGVLAFYKTLS